MKRQEKISLGEMRAMGVRGLISIAGTTDAAIPRRSVETGGRIMSAKSPRLIRPIKAGGSRVNSRKVWLIEFWRA